VSISFEGFTLDADRRELGQGSQLIAIGPQVFDVLVYLVKNRDRVVSKDELLDGVWGGRIVSLSTLGSHISAVRRAVGDNGGEQRLIRTVARKGFRFVGDVQETVAAAQHATPRFTTAIDQDRLEYSDKPSIAVLPFRNLSGDPQQEYFADGMVEEITTAIARIPWLFVIAPNSSFTYKDKLTDLTQVARELGVRYLLEGSVRRAENRVRISGKLIDTTTGAHLWAERFDGALRNIFELQDRVASGVAGAIRSKLISAEISRAARKPAASLDAYDLYLRAIAEIRKPNLEGCEAALSLCRRALAVDPSCASAASLIGVVRAYQWTAGVPFTADEAAEALQLAQRAIETDNDPDVLARCGHTLALLGGAHDAAVSALEKATMLNPNSARAWGFSAAVNCYANRPDAAIAAAERAMCLSPVDPFGYQYKFFRGYGLMLAGRYQEALEWIDRCLYERPNFHPAIRARVALCGYLNLTEQVGNWVSRQLETNPAMTISGFAAFGAKHLSPGALSRWINGFRRAGVPEK
jgi:TolB-like protein